MLIIGPDGITPPSKCKIMSKAQIAKVKAQLLEYKKVNKVIAHLCALPDSTAVAAGEGTVKPIHTVCLSYPEQEAEEKHFHRTSIASSTRRNLELYHQAKANKVIQAHKSGFFGHFKHHKKPRRVFSSSDIEADADNAASSMPLRALRLGVLSTLLTLYDQPRTPSASSGSELPTPSRPSFDDSSKPSFANDCSFSFDTLSCTFTSPSVGSLTSTAVGAPSTSRNCTFNFTLPGTLGDSYPAQFRSATGIFGPLIASTGNIASAAAPR
ncbi:hypothetical protein EW146_g2754 [Bondarzewia mesenterica]|uniref:Uncharacterized protein n=1 Tax=Bondarzewia mesenterica TaxID=1095465 RepID=A0A4V3XFM8_9AGAM|nr:hypothetical protein EW146_g2754 [Bondarzewia mesenterica]